MKIGNLANLSGVSRDTIRLYEKLGLLTHISRPYEFNNYKDYGEENVRRIKMVKQLQQMGATLKECKEIFDALDKDEFDENSGRAFFQSKIEQIEFKMRELAETKKMLMERMNQCPKHNPLKKE